MSPLATSCQHRVLPTTWARGGVLSWSLQRVCFALLVAAMLLGCEGSPPPEDTDEELFRTQEQLTGARLLNLAKRVSDFHLAHGRLPSDTHELPSITVFDSPADDPRNDAWGRPILITAIGRGFELRSNGADGEQGTDDDVVFRARDVDSVEAGGS